MVSYRYRNVELTPAIMAELIVLLYSGKQFSRSDCIETVVKYHLDNGGICNHKTYMSTFKRATTLLRNNNCSLENVGYGIWRFNNEIEPYVSYWNKPGKYEVDNEKIEEIGSGNETIYVYYYPTYRKFALLTGNTSWYCKVGMTTKNLWDRIYSQSSTCFPEEPLVALTIRCPDARHLESILHNILKMKNKWIETAPGKEWFLTSPEEIKEIYQTIVPD